MHILYNIIGTPVVAFLQTLFHKSGMQDVVSFFSQATSAQFPYLRDEQVNCRHLEKEVSRLLNYNSGISVLNMTNGPILDLMPISLDTVRLA